jgi:hypothetical protein
MLEAVVAPLDPRDFEPGALESAYEPVPANRRTGSMSGDLEVQRVSELPGYTVLVDHHLHCFAEVGDCFVPGGAVAVGAAGLAEPGMRTPHAVLILLDGVRDMHDSHVTQCTRAERSGTSRRPPSGAPGRADAVTTPIDPRSRPPGTGATR